MTFNGVWKVDRSEGYEKFMAQMGINMMMRTIGAHDNLKITLDQHGDKFHVTEASNFRKLELDFRLGVPFEYAAADGTKLSGSWVMEGDVLKGTFVRQDNKKTLNTVRQIVDGELVQSYSYDGVDAKRIFKMV